MKVLTKYQIHQTGSPFWAFAIHDGHQVDPSLISYVKLNGDQRLREEDPFTALMADLPINQFIVESSRFQLDLNRNLDNAIYLNPEQAWGLTVWSTDLPQTSIRNLQQDHQEIYATIDRLIQETIKQHGFFIIYDIHSYNAKRNSPEEEIDCQENPQINLGTAYINKRWDDLVQQLIHSIKQEKLDSKEVDVRANVKFKGGELSQYLNRKYGEYGCVISFEFRKDFMDEWTGIPDLERINEIRNLLQNSLTTLNQYFYHDGKE